MKFSKVNVDDMVRYIEKENLSLKQEQERLKSVVTILIDENSELMKRINFLQDEVQALKYEKSLISIISCIGTVVIIKSKFSV